jgi:hypothetical protein
MGLFDKGSSDYPTYDAGSTAKAQGAANVDTAVAQAFLNTMGQKTPFGNVSYNQTGSQKVGDYTIPQFEQSVTLNPQDQQNLDQQRTIQGQALGLGQTAIGNVASNIGQPFSTAGMPQAPGINDFSADRKKVEDAVLASATSRLDPMWNRQQAQTETQLVNQGLGRGSEAWNNAMQDFNFGKNDAYSQAINDSILAGGNEQSRLFGLGTTARQNAVQEAAFQRSQPINELATLLGLGGQVQAPQFSAAPQTGIQGTDVTGAQNMAYQGQLNQYNQNKSASNAAMGGLFGLGGSALGGWAQGGFK